MTRIALMLLLFCSPAAAMAGQVCINRASPAVASGTDGHDIMDTAGHRPSEWMNTLPYPLVPIVRSQLGGFLQSDNVLSIDKNQNQLAIGGGPYLFQGFKFTDQPWFSSQPLSHNGGGVTQDGPFIPPLILDRRTDSVWMDVSNNGSGVSQASWQICWDADLAATLNAGWQSPDRAPPPAGSGWQTSAGLVVGDGNGSNWDNYTIAVAIQPGIQSNRSIELINTGGSQIRVTVAAGTSNTPIIGAVIGPAGGPMTTLTWDGGSVGTTVPAFSQKTSDGVPFTFDRTKPLVFKYLTGSGGASVRFANSIPGWATYWRVGNDFASANYLPAAGYTVAAASVVGLIRVETLH